MGVPVLIGGKGREICNRCKGAGKLDIAATLTPRTLKRAGNRRHMKNSLDNLTDDTDGTKKYLPINANVTRHESEPYDKLERNLISLQALIGTSMRRTSLVKRGAFRNKMQRVAKRKYPACNRHVVIIASLSPVPPRCCVNHESLSSIFSCIWFVTWWKNLFHF